MITAVAALASRIPTWVWILLVSAALFAGGGLAFKLGANKFETIVETARQEARDAQDAKWREQIALANLEIEKTKARQVAASAAADARLRDQSDTLQKLQSDLEKANAALPNGDACGLDGDRVRLLPK